MNRVTSDSDRSKRGIRLKNNEFVLFVAKQFKHLARKNLRVPIQLYHL